MIGKDIEPDVVHIVGAQELRRKVTVTTTTSYIEHGRYISITAMAQSLLHNTSTPEIFTYINR